MAIDYGALFRDLRRATSQMLATGEQSAFDQRLEAVATSCVVAVASWAIAHDIPAKALSGPFWKRMNNTLNKVAPTYVPVNPQKLNKKLLPILKEIAVSERNSSLEYEPDVGRTLTGDGATKKVPLINFLCHVPGKGVTPPHRRSRMVCSSFP